jgi:hypothetical protein
LVEGKPVRNFDSVVILGVGELPVLFNDQYPIVPVTGYGPEPSVIPIDKCPVLVEPDDMFE